ncbi:MAG: hypothetical protein FWH52_01010 [Synergistaceae bacterium]|nr:hypothetical protein [Synergistaceae bacterium]
MRLRTISTAMDEIRKIDPGTALTQNALRKAVIEGRIPHKLNGNRILVDVDTALAFFYGGVAQDKAVEALSGNAEKALTI